MWKLSHSSSKYNWKTNFFKSHSDVNKMKNQSPDQAPPPQPSWGGYDRKLSRQQQNVPRAHLDVCIGHGNA